MSIETIGSPLDLIALPISDFVDASYHILLGRHPTSPEREERAGVVRAGLGRTRFIADMCMSPEYQERWNQMLSEGDDAFFIHAMFQRYLNRSADPDGMKHYMNLLARGKSRARTARDIASSYEAKMARTFWFELNHLIALDHAERHWLKRWFGHHRRQRMLRNQAQEACMRYRPTHMAISQPAPAPQQMPPPFLIPTSLPSPVAALSPSDRLFQGYKARRVLSRLRHAAGTI